MDEVKVPAEIVEKIAGDSQTVSGIDGGSVAEVVVEVVGNCFVAVVEAIINGISDS